MVVTGSLLVATAIYAPVAPFLWPSSIPADAAWSVLGLAVVCTAAAFLLFFALIAEIGPARATVITYINPAVAILLGVLVLSEPLTIGMAIGFPLVIVGSILGTASSPGAGVTTPADYCLPPAVSAVLFSFEFRYPYTKYSVIPIASQISSRCQVRHGRYHIR